MTKDNIIKLLDLQDSLRRAVCRDWDGSFITSRFWSIDRQLTLLIEALSIEVLNKEFEGEKQ